MRVRSAAFLLALFAAWSGCAHVPEIEKADPGFSFDTLRKGGVVNIAVVEPDVVTQPPGPLTDAFEKILRIMCSDVPVTQAARARSSLDGATTRFLLLGYQMHGVAEAPWLARAADSLDGLARYAALMRVESNALRYTHRPAPIPDVSKGAARSDTSHAIDGNVPVTLREIVVRVDLYDLQTRGLAFGGSYFGSAVSAERDTIPTAFQGEPEPMPVAQARLGVLTLDAGPKDRPAGYGYPTPPPLARALESAYLEFVRSLPGGPK